LERVKRFAVQLDGPRAFAANSRTALGGTRARDALLTVRGWRPVALPFFEWAPLRSDYERKLYLRAKLSAAGLDVDAAAARGAARGRDEGAAATS
jgi:hypothetical protein